MAARRGRRPGKKPKESNFRLGVVSGAAQELKNVPVLLRSRVQEHLEALAREGCRVAGYSLSGQPPWPHLCSKHIDGWRVIVAFPSETEVVVIKVAPHNAAVDPYRDLANELGIEVSTAERTKPACCDGPPLMLDDALLDLFEEAFGQLTGDA